MTGAIRPLNITLYTRPGCHLCQEAKELVLPLLREFAATLREVNIDEDPQLATRYGLDIPVISLEPTRRRSIASV